MKQKFTKMKKRPLLTILFIAIFYCISITTSAQNRVAACITLTGEIIYQVEMPQFRVSISPEGKLVNYTILSNGDISYNINGRVNKIGQISLSYDFDERIVKIGGESFRYDFDGRINEIGSIKITYNLERKIDKIGEYKISYNINGKVDRIGLGTISYNFNGKIQGIKDTEGIIYLGTVER